MKTIIGVLLCIPLLMWAIVRIYFGVVYDINCEGYLKRAADANTVELAKTELSTAIKYIEEKGWTSGYTSVLYKTPDEDVSFWYNNITSSLNELTTVSEDATQLEKSNLLMKLRETLLDQGEKSIYVTAPKGISVYPNNKFWALFCLVSIIVAIPGVYIAFLSASRTIDKYTAFGW